MKARTKSSPFWSAPTSVVNGLVLSSTDRVLVFIRIISFMCSTIGLTMASQFSFSGVYLCAGHRTVRVSEATWVAPAAMGGNDGLSATSAAAPARADTGAAMQKRKNTGVEGHGGRKGAGFLGLLVLRVVDVTAGAASSQREKAFRSVPSRPAMTRAF